MKLFNHGVRFLLEVCALITLGYWGATIASGLAAEIALAIVAPVIAATIWAVFVSPNSTRKLRDPYRVAPELVVFGSAAAGLVWTGHAVLGIVLLVLYGINRVWLSLLERPI